MNPLTNRWGLLVTALTIIALGGALVLVLVPAPKTPLETATTTPSGTTTGQVGSTTATTTTGTQAAVSVSAPAAGSAIVSPLTISGSAPGTWYFEASFPVQLLDHNGTVIAQGPAQAQSDWMTTGQVPFKATLTFPAQPKGSTGTLVLKNDNPSGDPARDQYYRVAVTF